MINKKEKQIRNGREYISVKRIRRNNREKSETEENMFSRQ
jgi:hypothetical protein